MSKYLVFLWCLRHLLHCNNHSFFFTFSADRAKQIKTTATVNEDPTEKLIRNLKEENEKLKALLEKANSGESIGKIDEKEDDDDEDDNEGLSEEGREESIVTYGNITNN